MNAASSSLRTGWLTMWIVLGVIALTLFVALPLAVTQRAQNEFARYQACLRKTQTVDCKPSLAWALNGWELTSVTSTSAVTSTQVSP